MGGLFELPHSGLPERSGLAIGLRERYLGVLNIADEATLTVRHTVTHHRIQASIFKATLAKGAAKAPLVFHRLDELDHLPLGGLSRKALRAALRPAG
jgi:hypothetical protein